MKKYLLLLLISTSFSYGQTTLANKLRITGNATDNNATKVNVQDALGNVNTISKVDLQDAFYFASASNFPVTGITDKLYIARDNNILYRFNGTIYTNVKVDESNFVHKSGSETVSGVKNFTDNLGLNEASPTAQLHLAGHTVNQGINWATVGGGNQSIQIQGHLDSSTATSDVAGGLMAWSASGTNSNVSGLMLQLKPGTVGNKTIRVLDAQNYLAGASTLNLLDASGTIGAMIESQGASTGDNIGSYHVAGFAHGRNIAGYFRAMQDGIGYYSTHQIGVMAVAGRNSGLSGYHVGGYFGLQQFYDNRNGINANAALIADNGDTPYPIFLGKKNSFDVFSFSQHGELNLTPVVTNTTPLKINALTGQSTNVFEYNLNGVRKFQINQNGDLDLIGSKLNIKSASTFLTLYDNSDVVKLNIDNGGSVQTKGRFQFLNSNNVDVAQAMYYDGVSTIFRPMANSAEVFSFRNNNQSIQALNILSSTGRILINTNADNNQGNLQVNGNITASPATLDNQVVVKSQLDLKADLASPALTGTPTAPTATAGTNTTQVATTAFVLANGSANAVLLTGNQSIDGSKSFLALANFKTVFMTSGTTATTLYVDNFASGTGIRGRNFAGGNFAFCESTGTGNGFVSNVPSSGTGFNFVGQNNETNTFTVDKFGFITASNLPIQLKDFFTDANNTGTTETDLYSYTTLANRLNATGEKIVAVYAGTFNDATASSQIKVVYGGQTIGDTGALTMSVTGAWIVNCSIMRTGANTARAMVSISTPGASTASYTKYTSLTGLTFTGTNILKITGTAGGATGGNDDITASYGNILWQPAAL